MCSGGAQAFMWSVAVGGKERFGCVVFEQQRAVCPRIIVDCLCVCVHVCGVNKDARKFSLK